jgi:glycosyltransferase involved in cell wall biosynthesis
MPGRADARTSHDLCHEISIMTDRCRVAFHDPRLSTITGGGEALTLSMIEALDPARFECAIVTRTGCSSPLLAEFLTRRPDVRIHVVDASDAGLAVETEAFLHEHDGWALWGKDKLVDDVLRFNATACRLYSRTLFDIVSVSVLVDSFGLPQGPRTILHIGGSPPVGMASAERPLLARYDAMSAVSAYVRHEFCSILRSPTTADAIRIVHPALGSTFAIPPTSGTRDIDVLFAGRLTPRKGVDLLLDAASSISERGGKLRLVIAGTGPCETELRERAGDLLMANPVEFTGAISQRELVGLLDRSQCFAYPTRKPEAFGLAPLEAMARGAVPIVGELGGMAEYIQSGDNAFVLPEPVASYSLAETIESALGDPAKLSRMASCGRRTAERFSWTGFSEAVNSVFAQVAAR